MLKSTIAECLEGNRGENESSALKPPLEIGDQSAAKEM
jgi:hypothetical protein